MIGNTCRGLKESRQRIVYITMFHIIYPFDTIKGVIGFRSFIKSIIPVSFAGGTRDS